MRPNAVHLVLAGLLVAASGCQESSSTSSTGSTASATSTGGAVIPPAASAPATDLTAVDKSIEVALPGDRSATLRYADVKIGDGSIAGAGSVVMVQYTGWLTDGTKFDSSLDSGRPYQFRIGDEPPGVIEGWDKGIRGMRVGGKRKLVIPAELAYGARGFPPVIPPNATLVFDVELLGAK